MITSDHKRNCRNNNITNINSLQTSFSMNYNKEQNKTPYNGYICNFKQFCKLNKRKSILVFLIKYIIYTFTITK